MPWVIGEYGAMTRPSGGGTEASAVSTEIISAQGSWPMGVASSVWTVTIPGAFAEAEPEFLQPGTLKSLVLGDGDDRTDQTVEFKRLWLAQADFSERNRKNGICVLTLHDDRKWWNTRFPLGPKSWNTEYNGERVEPQTYTPGTYRSVNPRYPQHKVGNVEEIGSWILDCLGVHTERQAIGRGGTSVIGFLVAGGAPAVPSYADPGTTIDLFADTPEFIVPPSMTALEALQKLLGMYDIQVALDPEDGRVGFVPLSGLPGSLTAIQDVIDQMQYPGGGPDVSHQVGAHGDSVEPDDLPDVIQITGAQMVLKGKYASEYVLPDPDRPGKYLLLNRISTMWAYGINMDLPERQHISDGEDVIRLAHTLALQANDWAEVPDRLKEGARQAFHLFRVSQPLELATDALVPQGSIVTREETRTKLVVGGSTVLTDDWAVTRRIAPAYRLRRDNSLGGGLIPQPTAGTRKVFEPEAIVEEAQPHRLGPVLQTPGGMAKAQGVADRPSTRGMDPNWARPKLWGINAIKRQISSQTAGYRSPDFVDLNWTPDYTDVSVHPEMHDAEDLGIELDVVDAVQLVFKSSVAIYGSDGRRGGPPRSVVLSGGAGSTAPPPGRSRAVQVLDGSLFNGRGATPEMLWQIEADTRGGAKTPWGTPFLWIEYAHPIASHNDTRDWTLAHSEQQSGLQDHWPDPIVTSEAFPSSALGRLPQVAGYAGEHPNRVVHQPMPTLRLLCEENRVSNSFIRDSGWRSGELTGRMVFHDVDFYTRAASFTPAGIAAAQAGGTFVPMTDEHHQSVLAVMRAVVQGLSGKINAYRQHADAVNAMAAKLYGAHRRFFPGTPDFLALPVDGAAITVTARPAEASMRVSANARGFRAYMSSMSHQAQRISQAHRANTGAAAALFGGGGGGGGGTTAIDMQAIGSQGTAEGAGTSGRSEHDAPTHRPAVGRTPMAISDQRDPNSRTISGGALNAGMDEVAMYQPESGRILVKREGPFVRMMVPGDWNEIWLDKVTGDDGREYWVNLDGFTTLYGAAQDRYHEHVGATPGTFLRGSEPFPILSADLVGAPGEERHGDITVICPMTYLKRLYSPGDAPGRGGQRLGRLGEIETDDQGNPIIDPATGQPRRSERSMRAAAEGPRHLVSKADELQVLDFEYWGAGTTRPIPLVEEKGWVATFIVFHEHFQMDPSRAQYVLDGTHTGPFGPITEANVREWLDFNPSFTVFSPPATGQHCSLLPYPTPSLQRVDFAPMSYYMAIVHLVEVIERMAEEVNALAILKENIRRAHSLAYGDAKKIHDLVCCLYVNGVVAGWPTDMLNCLYDIQKALPDICMQPCEDAGPVETGGP